MHETLNKILLKPRFSIEVQQPKDFIIEKFKDNLNQADCKYCSKMGNDHIFIDLPKEEQKIWSPQLEVVIEAKKEGSVIRGLFAPKPSMWTLFIFLHFVDAIAFLIFFALYYAHKVSDKETNIWIIAMLACVIVWIALYLLGQLGKKKSTQQIQDLKQFLIKTLNHLNIK